MVRDQRGRSKHMNHMLVLELSLLTDIDLKVNVVPNKQDPFASLCCLIENIREVSAHLPHHHKHTSVAQRYTKGIQPVVNLQKTFNVSQKECAEEEINTFKRRFCNQSFYISITFSQHYNSKKKILIVIPPISLEISQFRYIITTVKTPCITLLKYYYIALYELSLP